MYNADASFESSIEGCSKELLKLSGVAVDCFVASAVSVVLIGSSLQWSGQTCPLLAWYELALLLSPMGIPWQMSGPN